MSNEPLSQIASPEKIRLFVAIFPPHSILAHLETAQHQLRKKFPGDGLRWTKPEQIHLTLHFIGSVQRERLQDFEATIQSAVCQSGSFHIRAEKTGCFPSLKHPRILWAGLSGDESALQTLKSKLDDAMALLGCKIEARKFHPHLTLARISELSAADSHRFAKEIATFDSTQFGAWTVKEIQLMQSKLSPEGAMYSSLKIFKLTPAPDFVAP